MRRICTTVAVVSSLLVAAGPAQAKSTVSHRQEMRVGAKQAHVAPQRINRNRTTHRVHGWPYGRT